jgi:hypothetical protein
VVRVPLASGEKLYIHERRSGFVLKIISCMKAQKCLRKGYPTFLAHVINKKSEESKLEETHIVRDYPEVFSEDFPGLPPTRQIEFQIDLTPGAAPIARAPYC